MRTNHGFFAALLFGCGALALAGADLPPINTPASQTYFPGKFVWGDLITNDPEGASRFYTGLFGWTTTTIERTTASRTYPYTVLSLDGRPVAGIVMRSLRTTDKVHGQWIGFVSVPDVKKALAATTAAGGHARGPAKMLPQKGVQAIIADPEGAELGVIHSSTGDPGEYLPDSGDWVWAQLFAHSTGDEAAFYHAVFGYEAVADSRNGPSDDQILVSGGYSRASVSRIADAKKPRAAWLLYVRVRDVKATAELAVKLGGRVIVPPSDTPSEYWRAVIEDPSGSRIGVVELENPRAEGKQP